MRVVSDQQIYGTQVVEGSQQWIALGDGNEAEFSDFIKNGPAPCEVCGIRSVNCVHIRGVAVTKAGNAICGSIVLVCGRHCNPESIRTLLSERTAAA